MQTLKEWVSMMIMSKKQEKNLYKGRYEARDFLGRNLEKHYEGSSYDSETGLLCYEKCDYLLDLLDPERKLPGHYITMNVFL